mmetsp:Transcript_37768/g.36213  ORF Transcript_37768/g.36213 Transcript_37768/m.36213 type:complete len:129 (-) Transcript_37768:188-574(-)
MAKFDNDSLKNKVKGLKSKLLVEGKEGNGLGEQEASKKMNSDLGSKDTKESVRCLANNENVPLNFDPISLVKKRKLNEISGGTLKAPEQSSQKSYKKQTSTEEENLDLLKGSSISMEFNNEQSNKGAS